MTVQRTSVQLWLEQAPTDPFDDDSTPRYRVVAALGQGATRRCIVPLTRAHDSEEQAMSVLSDKILRGRIDGVLRVETPLTKAAAEAMTATLGEPMRMSIGAVSSPAAADHVAQAAVEASTRELAAIRAARKRRWRR